MTNHTSPLVPINFTNTQLYIESVLPAKMTKSVRFATPDDLNDLQLITDEKRNRARASRSAWGVDVSPRHDQRIMLPPRRPERRVSCDFQDSMLVDMDDSECDDDYYPTNKRICTPESISRPVVEECEHMLRSIQSIVSPYSVVETSSLSIVPLHDHDIWDSDLPVIQTTTGGTFDVKLPSRKTIFNEQFKADGEISCGKKFTNPPPIPLLHDDELKVRTKLVMLARKIENLQNRL